MLNILYVFDDHYAPYAGISITSLLENNKGTNIRIFCTGMDVSTENIGKIEDVVRSYGQKIDWIDSTKSVEYINSCSTGTWNGSKATWMKVFCLWELPEEVETILYIDSDSLVLGQLQEIEKITLQDHFLAMAYDSLGNTNGSRNFGLKEYYNAGVILFNVQKWKQDAFQESFLRHLRENVHKYWDNEQGLLNDFFRDKIIRLSLKCNAQGFLKLFRPENYLRVYNDFPFYEATEIRDALQHPVICHFFRAFGDYPWEKGNIHPYRDLYREWKAASLWKDESDKKKKKNFVYEVEKILYRIMPERAYLKLYRSIVERNI